MHLLSMDTGELSTEIELARRSNFASCTWRTFSYIIGGLRIEAVRSVQKYNFTSDVWIGIPSAPIARNDHYKEWSFICNRRRQLRKSRELM